MNADEFYKQMMQLPANRGIRFALRCKPKHRFKVMCHILSLLFTFVGMFVTAFLFVSMIVFGFVLTALGI